MKKRIIKKKNSPYYMASAKEYRNARRNLQEYVDWACWNTGRLTNRMVNEAYICAVNDREYLEMLYGA
ncbi:hypothetical protein ACEPPO_00780 (plasmid) [Limosilactobacillus fermentum]